MDIVLRIGFLRYPAAARATNQHPENGGFQSMAVPPSHPKLDHCNIETLGDLGISHFAEPPNRFCLVLNIYIYRYSIYFSESTMIPFWYGHKNNPTRSISQTHKYWYWRWLPVLYIYMHMHDLIYILHTIATIYKAMIYVKPTISKDWDRMG